MCLSIYVILRAKICFTASQMGYFALCAIAKQCEGSDLRAFTRGGRMGFPKGHRAKTREGLGVLPSHCFGMILREKRAFCEAVKGFFGGKITYI